MAYSQNSLGRTRPPVSARPVVTVRGRGSDRVNVAGVVCYRDGERPYLFYRLHVYHGRKGEPKTFFWMDYRDLIVAIHQHLGAPLVWCWDNLNVHLAGQLADFATANADWLRIVQLPSYAPELNPPRATGRCSAGPWPTSPSPTCPGSSGSSNAS
ncbi:transposase [Nonomuraea bangladeshensis]|uniref:transposase n=1 Tax=Nonomuraea bangladeshensis TaxID=404385 RepID=UPI0031DDDAFE